MTDFWEDTEGDFEPMEDKKEQIEPAKKKAKVPDAVTAKVGADLVGQIDGFAEDLDSVKVYDNARRFEKRKELPTREREAEETFVFSESDYVEFYWDNNTSTIVQETGVHRLVSDPKVRFETALFPPGPVQKTITTDSKDGMDSQLKEMAEKLTNDGYKEVEHFIELHRLHLPCFTWVCAEPEADKSSLVHSSQIGGYPALYEGEAFPKYCIFAFQIDLETIPPRMQCMMGSCGLLQFFMPPTGACDIPDSGHCRIVPKEDFPKLVRSELSHGAFAVGHDELKPKPRRIIDWVERRDYPTRDDCDGNDGWEDKVLSYTPSDWNSECRYTLVHKSDDLSFCMDKFGGYGKYWQDEQPGNSEYIPCRYCGGKHLYRHAVFHMFDMDNGGTARICYCPVAPEKTYWTSGSCT